MKTIHTSAVIALTLALSAWSLQAQSNNGPQRRFGPGPDGDIPPPKPPPLIGALDANHDRTISADEIANASAALQSLDKNNDGQLTVEELHPRRVPPNGEQLRDGPKPPRRPQGPPPLDGEKPPVPPMIKALDVDEDGVISATEVANAANSLRALDKNNDGQLTVDELRPDGARPRGPRPPQGPDADRQGPPPGE